MPIETYEQAVAFWNSRINYEKIGMPQDMGLLKLDRMRLLLSALGNPHEQYQVVHVTGTKGKGSTATMIASVLRAEGYRTGLYTSPHLVHVEERIQVNGRPIDRIEMTGCMNRIALASEQIEREGEAPPTFFEIITAVGMLHFAQQKVDFAMLEVGMGGRFDATNVVNPLVSVITTIGIDHVEQLGPTLESIAFEKAGIIKKQRPVVSGVRASGPADVIAQQAAKMNAPLYRLGFEFDRHWKSGDLAIDLPPQVQWFQGDTASPWYDLNLWGRHQADNAAIAIQTLKLLQQQGITLTNQAYQTGLKQAHIPGRLDVLSKSPWLILDAAHNADSIQVLLEALCELPVQRRTFLFAVSKDKLIREMLALMIGQCDSIVFTRYSSSNRGAEPELLLNIWQDLGGTGGQVIEPATDAWCYLVKQAMPNELVCATGSVFLVGEIHRKYRLDQAVTE